jgi:GNAT superfamily N-acetyltransferase
VSHLPALRLAHAADTSALAAIQRDAILVLSTPVMSGERALDWASSSADARVLRAITQIAVWVPEDENIALGWIEIDGHRVEGLYVRAEKSRSGIGSTLLRPAESMIRTAGHSTVSLDASPNAEAFYLRHGEQPLARESSNEAYPMVKQLCPVR